MDCGFSVCGRNVQAVAPGVPPVDSPLTGGKCKSMKAVITVIGKDMTGIIARVSSICSENKINITEATQSVLQDVFAMIMLVDISSSQITCAELSDKMDELGKELGLTIHVMHENLLHSMHRI